MKSGASVMVFTLNEEIHLESCLKSLEWCDDVIVIDSFSQDNTEKIAKQSGARFFQHAFVGFGSQRQWAIQNTSPKHEWILILDADERVSEALAQEVATVTAISTPDVAAYRLRRRFHLWGRWLKYSSLYPVWVVRLIHKDRVVYFDRGHAESQTVNGKTLSLENDLIDENLKGIEEWFQRQKRYAEKEAIYEIEDELNGSGKISDIFSQDPMRRQAGMKRLIRQFPFRPHFYFIYSYFFRLGFLDGKEGFLFCRMKSAYHGMIVSKKRELKSKQTSRVSG